MVKEEVMVCSYCGTQLARNAAYCHSCGQPIQKNADAEVESPNHSTDSPSTTSVETTSNLQQAGKSRVTSAILVLCWIALVGISAAILLGPRDAKSLQSLVIGCMVIGIIIAKRKRKSGWLGALIGFVAAFLLGIVLYAAKPLLMPVDNTLERSPEYLALKEFDPAAYEKVMATLKDLPPSALLEATIVQTQPVMIEVMSKALRQTSEDATLQYAKNLSERYAEIAEVTTPEECAAFFTAKTTPEMAVHIARKISSKQHQTDDFKRIVTDAVHRPSPYKPNPERYRTLYTQIGAAIRAEGGVGPEEVFADPPVLPPKLVCSGSVQFFHKIMQLSPGDRSFFLRAFILD